MEEELLKAAAKSNLWLAFDIESQRRSHIQTNLLPRCLHLLTQN